MTEIARRNIIVEYESRSDEFRKAQEHIAKNEKGLAAVFATTKKAIESTNKAQDKYSDALGESSDLTDEMIKLLDQYGDALTDDAVKVEAIRNAIQQLNKINSLEAKVLATKTGSYENLTATLELNRIKLQQLTKEEILNTKEGKELAATVADQTKELKDWDKQLGTGEDGAKAFTEVMERMGGPITGIIRDLKLFRTAIAAKVIALRASITGLTGASRALQIFKIALASTGIGALVVVLGTLITFFSKTQRGVDFVTKTFAGLQAAVSVVIDRIAGFGEGLVDIFSGRYAQGAARLRAAVSGVGAEIAKEAKEASNLRAELNALVKQENEFILTQAKARKQIEELRAESARLRSTEKAASAEKLKEAEKIQNEVYEKEIELARERSRILNEQTALGESSDDEIRAANEAAAAVNRLEAEKFARSRELITQQGELSKSAADQRKREQEEELKRQEELLKLQKEGAQAVRELNLSLLEEGLQKELEIAKEAARQQMEAAKGTDEQIAEQRRLIEVQLIRRLKELRDDANRVRLQQEKDLQKMIQDTFEQTAKEEEERLAKLDAIAVRDVNRALTARTTAIKEALKNEEISEEEAQIKIAQARIKALEEQIDLTLNDYDLRLQLEQQLVDAQIELQKSLTAATKQEQQERLEAAKSIVDSITQILNVAFEREAERINNSIKLQEDRVNKAREIADKGNAEILQLEEQRLKKLQEQREQAAQKQRALQAIQIAANAALAISNTIATVTGEGAKGGIPGLIAAGVAIAATVAAAIASIQGALSSVPAFREGVDVFQGKGTTTSDSNLVRISKGERVVDAKTNNKLVKLGVNNDNIARVAAIGMEALRMPQISQEVLQPVSKKGNNGGIKDLKKEIRKNTLAIQSLGVSATIDADGFTAKIGKRNKLRERRRKMLR